MSLSPTLAINEEIKRRRHEGLPVVALGFGEASIPVHPMLVEELARFADRGGYGEVAGMPELRKAAAGYWSRRGVETDAEQVVAGPGSKPLLFAIFEALSGPVLIPQPSWVSYSAQNEVLNRRAVFVPTGDEGGVPDPDRISALCGELAEQGEPASAVLITLPDNPTGAVASPERVRRLCDVAVENDLLIISDEIYLDLVHDPDRPVVTPAEIVPDRTITTTGLSKNLALGGWRIGVARFPHTSRIDLIRERVVSVASEIWSAPAHPVQLAAASAFDEPPALVERIAASRDLHGAIARRVAEVFRGAGATVADPAGAFYIYPSFASLSEKLKEQGIHSGADLANRLLADYGIATLPGEAFGDVGDRFTLRIAIPMLYGESDAERLEALSHPDPGALPWIADKLSHVSDVLRRLTGVTSG